MSEGLIKNYCRLITSDTDACLELFHRDAAIITKIGTEFATIEGRDKIRAFLDMTPSFLEYELGDIAEEKGFLVARIKIEGAHRTPENFRFFFDEGLIRRLEMNGDDSQ